LRDQLFGAQQPVTVCVKARDLALPPCQHLGLGHSAIAIGVEPTGAFDCAR